MSQLSYALSADPGVRRDALVGVRNDATWSTIKAQSVLVILLRTRMKVAMHDLLL